MGRYFGREPRYTREEIELQAKQELEARVNMGRPPAEDFAPIEARLAELDREMAARAPVVAVPAPPARRREQHPALSITEVRLPATAKAGRPAGAATGTAAAAKATSKATSSKGAMSKGAAPRAAKATRAGAGTAVVASKPRAPRRPVGAEER